MAIFTHSSYQDSFEEDRHSEWDPGLRRFTKRINLQNIISRCDRDPARVAEFLFARVIYREGSSSISKIGYSYVCVASIDSEPYIFLGYSEPGWRLTRGYLKSQMERDLKISFDFWAAGGKDHVKIIVDHGTEAAHVTGFSLYHKQSQFYGFLAAVVATKRVTIYYPDSEFMDTRPSVQKATFAVRFWTRRKILNIIRNWE